MKKIIFYNLLLLFILFGILEFISYILIRNDAKDYMDAYNKNAKKNGDIIYTQRYAPVKVFNQDDFENSYRLIQKGDEAKGSILFFGCSYTYGSEEEEEHILPYLVNKYTNITTVNRGIPGGSILNTLYDLNNDNFYYKIKDLPKPKYIIYTYINDHLNRLSNPYRCSVIPKQRHAYYDVNNKLKNKNGRIVAEKPSKLKLFLYSLYTTKAYYYFFNEKLEKESKNERMIRLLQEAKKITDEKFSNPTFIILLYKDGSHYTMGDYEQNELKKHGFIILDAEELAGHELETEIWRAGDKEHPNYAAFNDVAKGLVKKLKL